MDRFAHPATAIRSRESILRRRGKADRFQTRRRDHGRMAPPPPSRNGIAGMRANHDTGSAQATTPPDGYAQPVNTDGGHNAGHRIR